MTKDEIAKLPTPKTDFLDKKGWPPNNYVDMRNKARSLEQRLTAAVMALESILRHEMSSLWPGARETLAAIKRLSK